MVRQLQLYGDYTRKEAHGLLEPDTAFTPQSGTWGLQGIIPLKRRDGDFVFFVTFGQSQGEHEFDEGISADGLLRWQSQPSQTLQSRQIQQFVTHEETINTIYLFLRTQNRQPYTYLGPLSYHSHDAERERPVHFLWQLKEWPVHHDVFNRIGLALDRSVIGPDELSVDAQQTDPVRKLSFVDAPKSKIGRPENTRSFKAAHRRFPKEEENRKLGLRGELLVLEHEILTLQLAGRADLAEKVRHVSQIEGDGAGYDILSYSADETERFIEVKTTAGPITSDFFISANEIAFASVNAEKFELIRVFNFNTSTGSAQCFKLPGNPTSTFTLIPIQFRAALSRKV